MLLFTAVTASFRQVSSGAGGCVDDTETVCTRIGLIFHSPLGRGKHHSVGHKAAPVVADKQDPIQPKGVHQGQHVTGDVIFGAPVRRWARPSVSGKIRGDDAQPRRRVCQQIPVDPVVLGPSVQRDHRPAVCWTREGGQVWWLLGEDRVVSTESLLEQGHP
jgi:hypothetical protein